MKNVHILCLQSNLVTYRPYPCMTACFKGGLQVVKLTLQIGAYCSKKVASPIVFDSESLKQSCTKMYAEGQAHEVVRGGTESDMLLAVFNF